MTVAEIITKHGVANLNRKRPHVYRRAYICKFLRDQGKTVAHIAKMIDRDHTAVINLLKVYNNNCNYPDFEVYVSEVQSDLQGIAPTAKTTRQILDDPETTDTDLRNELERILKYR